MKTRRGRLIRRHGPDRECLVLLGLGTAPGSHLTVETLQAARLCDRVYWEGLTSGEDALLRRALGPGVPRRLPPGSGARRAVIGALRRGLRVGLATPLHPLVWSGLAPGLVLRCRRSRTPWESLGAVLPATVGVAAAGLALGVGPLGLQCVEGCFLAEPGWTLSRRWPTVAYFQARRDFSAWRPALSRLGAVYGKRTTALLWRPGRAPRRLALERLVSLAPPAGIALVCVEPPG